MSGKQTGEADAGWTLEKKKAETVLKHFTFRNDAIKF